MRLVPGTDTVPNAVNKYLLPHEHQVITVRKHPAVLLRPIIVALAGLVFAAVISTTVAQHHSGVVGFVWIAWAVALVWLAFKVWSGLRITSSSRPGECCWPPGSSPAR